MALPENNSSRSGKSKIQAFILEPILTPSGLLDGGDDGVDLALFDVDLPEDIDPLAEIDQDFSDEELEPISFFDELETDQIAEIADISSPNFDSGVFTVGDTGEVTVDFLFDGGGYEGELAIFSLEGLNPESEDFSFEAANRALSDSELGHVVISDATEGAKFSGELGEADRNSGIYQQGDPVKMKPGDRFGFMLIPNGTVEEFLDNPDKGNLRPLFSVATANPDDAFHLGQIADVTGDGNTFVMEDWRVDDNSDRDYNDLIFQVRGATGEAELLDNVIEEGKEWRDSDLGEAILEYANPQVDPPVTDYNFPVEDQPLIGFIDTGFSGDNPDLDYEKISLGTDKIANDANPLLTPGEGNEHGTHVLGIVAAQNDNDIGIDGINDDAPLWLGRAVGSGEWAESLMEFVDAARESGQPNGIANLSFDLTQIDIDGVETTRYEFTPSEMAALEYARQNNVLVAVAAGNEGEVMSALGQASQHFDNVITVGSAEQISGETSVWQGFDRAEYSNHGEGLDIVANGGNLETPVVSTVGNGVGTMAGTSVATAKVTGAASQVWAANPNLNYRQVIDILKSTAADINELGEDLETGAGLLNIAAAVSLARTVDPEVYNPKLQQTPPIGKEPTTPWERAVFQNFPVPNTNTLAGKKIILDPGHGITDTGFDPGAGGNGTNEATENLHQAKIVAEHLRQLGAEVKILDEAISLAQIGQRAAGYDLFVSLHLNAFNKDAQGHEVYSHPNAPSADSELAKAVNSELDAVFPDNEIPNRGVKTKDLSVLRNAPLGVPAVLTESLFIDAPGMSRGNVEKAGHAIARGIEKFFTGSATGSNPPPSPKPQPQPAPPKSGVVNSKVGNDPLNFRTSPEVRGDNLIGQLPKGKTLKVLESVKGKSYENGLSDEWYKVEVDGQQGFVAAYYVDIVSQPTDFRAENFSGWVGPSIGVALRNSPKHEDRSGLAEPYKKTLHFDGWTYGESVNDIWTDKPDALWYRYWRDGKAYWVPSAYIFGYPNSKPPIQPGGSSDPGNTTKKGHVNANVGNVSLNFRNKPSVSGSTIIGKLPKGTAVTIRKQVSGGAYYPGNRTDWYEIEANGQVGYVAAYYISEGSGDSGGGGGGTVKTPLLTQQGVNYFKARPQFYTTGNIFSQASYGSNLVDGYSRTEGNCTWYAHGRVKELGGNPAALNSMSGNANQWHYQLSNGAYIVSDPQPGDIAQWTRNGQNHVAVVEKTYYQNGVKRVVLSESHYNTNFDGGGAGTLHRIVDYTASNPDRYIRVPGV